MQSFRVAIFAALALHTGVLTVGAAMRARSLLAPEDSLALRSIDIELPDIAPPRPEPVAPRPLPPVAENLPVPAPRPLVPDRAILPREVAPAPPPSAALAPPAPVPSAPPVAKLDMPPDAPGGLLTVPGVPGLDGNAVWTMPGLVPRGAPLPAPTVAPMPREVDPDIGGQVVREAMEKRDQNLGLDLPAAGTAAAVLADVVRASDVPDVCRGSIEFRLSATGQVLGYRVVGSTGGSSETWNRVARDAAARLAARGLSMTAAYSRGATITVNVVSNVQLPAGSSGGLSVPKLSYDFDLSNVGAHATRVVRTSFRVAAAR